eukprot:4219206-Pleurochrysis_carterae.AAC.1
MSVCPASSLPRKLRNVLPLEERQHLARLYFEHTQKKWKGKTYYPLLYTLAANKKEDDLAWSA